MAASTPPLKFSLVVDDFGIKYERQEDITHILDALKTIYKISEDWDGKLYCGLNLEWDSYKREMPMCAHIANFYLTNPMNRYE